MKYPHTAVRLLVASFLLTLLGGCTNTDSGASSYPIYDSGVWADSVYSPSIYWLDSHRAIFKGTAAKQKTDAYENAELQIWDMDKNKVTPYAKTTKGISCYANGNIFYWVPGDKPGENRYRYGKLGQEETREYPKDKKLYVDAINCQTYDMDVVVKERKDRAITPLLTRHGHLDIGPISGKESLENNPVILRHADGSMIQLPVRQSERGTLYDYFPFKGAYFFQGSLELGRPSDIAKLWPPGTRQIFYWLHPDGRIEPIVLRGESWPDGKVPNFGIRKFMPLQEGFFLLYGSAKGPKDPGTAGGYLLRNDKLTKIVSGHLSSLTVSPDGCKVAFVHLPYPDADLVADPAPIRLKAVDLCTERATTSNKQ